MRAVRVASIVIVLLAAAAAAWAQTSSLEVRVTDPDRAVVVSAAVILTPLPNGAPRTELTGSQGVARFADLAPGEYRVEITARNFETHAETVTLTADDRVVDASLRIASFQQEVTVEAVATVPTIGRVSTPLRDQPLTVHTLTAEFLKTNAVNDVVTALQYVPNVVAYSQYGVYQYFTFRGIGDNLQLVDGIRNEGNRVSTQLANVDKLEVLKGPASVLYGGGAVGGTVNIVLKKPSPEPFYELSGTASRWDAYRGAFGAAGRLGPADRLFYRLDVGGDSSTNFRNDPSKRLNVTPSVAWRLSDAARLDVRYMFDRNRVSGDSGIPLVPLTGGFVPSPDRTAVGDPLGRAIQGDGSDFIPSVSRTNRYNTPQDFGLATDHNLRASYSHMFARGLAVRNTVSYRRFHDEYWVTEFLDVTPPSRVNRGFLYFEHFRDPVMNQAEVSGQFRTGVAHDYLVGYDVQQFGSITDRRAGANFNTTTMDLYAPVETHAPVDVHSFPVTRKDHVISTTNAVFFQDTVTVAAPLKVVVGARFDQVKRQNYNNPVVNGAETQVAINRTASEKGTYRVGLVYQPVSRLDIYAQQSTSFLPNFNVQLDGTPLLPEYGAQIEVGQRLRLIGERLQISAAGFNIEKRNLTRSLGAGRFEQVGKVRSRGFETEATGSFSARWGVSGGYGFVDAEFMDFFSGTINLAGRTPRRVPRHTMTLSTYYNWPNGVSLSGGLQSLSRQFINDPNTVAFNGYGLLNLGASYTHGRVQYQLNLTNVTDTQYWASSLGNRQLYPGQPFNVLASVRIRTN